MNSIKPLSNPITGHSGALFIVISFLIVYLSGDHVFNKTDYLKLAALATCCTVGYLIFTKSISKNLTLPLLGVLVFLLIPSIATIPGNLIHSSSYGTPYAWAKKLCQVLWCLLLLSLLLRENIQERFWLWLTIPILYVCILALMEAIGINPLIRFYLNPFERIMMTAPPPYTGPVDRPASTFGNVNYFAAVLIQLLPIYCALALTHATRQARIYTRHASVIFSLVTVLMLVCLALTETRAAIIAFLFAMAIFLITYFSIFRGEPPHAKKPHRLHTFSLLLIVIATVLLVILWLNPELLDRFAQLRHSYAWKARITSWETAWQSIQAAPLFGYGLGASYRLFFAFRSPDFRLHTGDASFNHVHNEWLEILQEGGFLGFIAYAMVWGYILYIALRVIFDKSQSKPQRTLVLAAVCGLIAYQIHGQFSVAQQMAVTNMTTGLLMALILWSGWGKTLFSRLKIQRTITQRGSIFTITAIVICTWVFLIPHLSANYLYANALALSSSQPDKMLVLAKQSTHIYTLYEAVKIAHEKEKHSQVLAFSKTLNDSIHDYRNTEYYKAYSLWQLDQGNKASDALKNVQILDTFHIPTLVLKSRIALSQNNQDSFLEATKQVSTFYGCRKRLIECSADGVTIFWQETQQQPIKFVAQGEQLTVSVNPILFNQLKSAISTQDSVNLRTITTSIAQSIASDDYFLPKSRNGSSVSDPHTLNALNELIAIDAALTKERNQRDARINAKPNESLLKDIVHVHAIDNAYQQQQQTLTNARTIQEQRLAASIDLNQFLQRRDFLHDIANWLYTVIQP